MRAIDVKDVTITYKTLQAKSIKKSLFSLSKIKNTTVEAVRGVSFTVNKGEIVGLVGRNGSGKSTLLRALAKVFSPDNGTIDTGDNSVALLAIGIGFQNDLSGYDNIYLSGLLMGYTKEEIDARYKEIVDFSELGEFIWAPVKTYSSGMYSKLAFSITAIMESDILLIDETLSVGDRSFKDKSLKKIKELISDENRTVIIVSHGSGVILDLCQRVIWMDEGKIVADGEASEVMSYYDQYMDSLGLLSEREKKKLAKIKKQKEQTGKQEKKSSKKKKAGKADAADVPV